MLYFPRSEKVLLRTEAPGPASAAVAQWIEHWPVDQKVASLIPGQGTCLGCRAGPQLGAHKRQLALPVH